MAKSKKEVTVAAQSEVAERPSFMGKADTSRGSEEVTINDLTIPRLSIIQDLSPQRKKNEPEYIEGAEEGMMFNTVTNQLYTSFVLFVPVYFRLEWVVWLHRDIGGGFVGAYETQEEAVAAVAAHPNAGQTVGKHDEPALEIQDTAQHFGLLLDPDSPAEDPRAQEIVISMSRSQLKPSRQLNSQVKLAGGDRFERYYRISPVVTDGKKGSYYNWKIAQLGFVSESIFKQSEALYDAVKSGARDVERGQASAGAKDSNPADDENM